MKVYLIISHLKRNGETFDTDIDGIAFQTKEDATSEIKKKIEVYSRDGGWKKINDFTVQNMNIENLTDDIYTCDWEIKEVYACNKH